jgi:hypothetical protein
MSSTALSATNTVDNKTLVTLPIDLSHFNDSRDLPKLPSTFTFTYRLCRKIDHIRLHFLQNQSEKRVK